MCVRERVCVRESRQTAYPSVQLYFLNNRPIITTYNQTNLLIKCIKTYLSAMFVYVVMFVCVYFVGPSDF